MDCQAQLVMFKTYNRVDMDKINVYKNTMTASVAPAYSLRDAIYSSCIAGRGVKLAILV